MPDLHRFDRLHRLTKLRRRIPDRRVGLLGAAKRIKQLLAVGPARALLRDGAAGGQRSTSGKRLRKSFMNSARSRSGSQESTMTASGCADSASAQAWAPPSASRTCQRRPVNVWESRCRTKRSSARDRARCAGRMRAVVLPLRGLPLLVLPLVLALRPRSSRVPALALDAGPAAHWKPDPGDRRQRRASGRPCPAGRGHAHRGGAWSAG